MKEITLDASVDNIGVVMDFVDEFLDENDCPMKIKMKIDIAIDELFGNIAQYAYTDEAGIATIRAEIQDNPKSVCITFMDRGVPFNPLEEPDPDITLPAKDRKIGGLGIYMVKKSMDDMTYEYKDEQNILRIRKKL